MIERVRRQIGQAGFLLVVLGLCVGTALSMIEQGAAARGVLGTTLLVLVALPIVNVISVLAEEIARRDWTFAWLGGAVLGLVGWAIVSRL